MERIRDRVKIILILLWIFGILFFTYLIKSTSKHSKIFRADIFGS
ncbi:hypothetical protein JGI24_01449 [Candidatus Kryptobacter tengchongensis]|uniref:Uncharacterized protein n=1 Tax=Kryptobacter tengchongensis TaxID=1643429 RepID=A0A656DBB1_KRYT1|nr:hypothetical protein JGI24_01449 [Candidatus Kryptobacter tengchongensis]